MTGAEMERAIEFLLKSQANFEARFEVAREQTNQQISELAASQQRTQQQLDQMQQQSDQMQQRVDQTQRQLDHLSNVVASVAEATQRNSADIDALVKIVGGLVEGRNGKSAS